MSYKREPILDNERLKTLRISPSSLNAFYGCNRKWYYEYIEARETTQTIALVRGNIVHYVLEHMFMVKYVPSGEKFRPHMMEKAEKLFDKKWKEDIGILNMSDEDLQVHYDESLNMIKRFFTKFCDNIQEGIRMKKFSNETQGYYYTKPTFKELWIDDEYKIMFNDRWKSEKVPKEEREQLENTLHVGGFIDSVQKDFDDNIILVDYKTSTKYQNVFSDDYLNQLSIYAYLWYKQTGKMPKYVAINYLKYDESFYMLVTPTLIANAVQKIKQMRANLIEFGLEKENYLKNETKLCDWCTFKEECMGIKDEN